MVGVGGVLNGRRFGNRLRGRIVGRIRTMLTRLGIKGDKRKLISRREFGGGSGGGSGGGRWRGGRRNILC
jgi:hypothetical protein